MDMRRLLPIILILFAALFILPQLFRKSSSSTLSSKDRALYTRDAMLRIDAAEKKAFAANGRYEGSLADLVVADKVLARELTVPLDVHIDLGVDGKSYVVRVSSDVLSVARARSGDKVVSSNCRVVRSSSGVKCPEPAPKKTTTTK
jgi:hypothetical protein